MKNSWSPARVLDASDRNYLETVLPLLDGARKEIVLSLYLVEPDDKAGAEHPVNRLLESLLRARKRGLSVHLYLNTNFRYRPKTEIGTGSWYERMAGSGMEITALLPGRRLHDKLIVIDNRYVIDGSMNWSEAALLANFESVTVIDAPAYATKKLERIAALTLPKPPKPEKKRATDRPLLRVPETVKVPAVILQKDYLPRMVSSSDARAADLYLFLRGQAEAAAASILEINLETAGLALGLPASWTRSALRRQMIKTLRKLSNPYGLIGIELPYAGNARITIRELPGEKISVPGQILSADHLASASSAETFLALAREALKKEGVKINSLSAPELEKRFGINRCAVIDARKKQVIDHEEDEN